MLSSIPRCLSPPLWTRGPKGFGPSGFWERTALWRSLIWFLWKRQNPIRRLELAQRLTALEAASARQDLLSLEIELFPFQPFADRIWELRANLTSHDACYVALAEALDLPLATLDRRLVQATGPVI